MGIYRLNEYEVWGNKKDGYDVNNVYTIERELYIEDGISDKDLIKNLKRLGYIKKNIHYKSIEIYGDDRNIYIDYKGIPQYELVKEGD